MEMGGGEGGGGRDRWMWGNWDEYIMQMDFDYVRLWDARDGEYMTFCASGEIRNKYNTPDKEER